MGVALGTAFQSIQQASVDLGEDKRTADTLRQEQWQADIEANQAAAQTAQTERLATETARNATEIEKVVAQLTTLNETFGDLVGAFFKPGMVVLMHGDVPDGWLECDGTEIDRNQYANLSSAMRDGYGLATAATGLVLPAATDLTADATTLALVAAGTIRYVIKT